MSIPFERCAGRSGFVPILELSFWLCSYSDIARLHGSAFAIGAGCRAAFRATDEMTGLILFLSLYPFIYLIYLYLLIHPPLYK